MRRPTLRARKPVRRTFPPVLQRQVRLGGEEQADRGRGVAECRSPWPPKPAPGARIDSTRQPECSAALYDQRQHRIAPPHHSSWAKQRANNSLVGATRNCGPDVEDGARGGLNRTAEATPACLSSRAVCRPHILKAFHDHFHARRSVSRIDTLEVLMLPAWCAARRGERLCNGAHHHGASIAGRRGAARRSPGEHSAADALPSTRRSPSGGTGVKPLVLTENYGGATCFSAPFAIGIAAASSGFATGDQRGRERHVSASSGTAVEIQSLDTGS